MYVCLRLIQVKMRDEAVIAPLFARMVEEFPDVAAGSYPQVRDERLLSHMLS
jgi:hypothetical protein